MEFNSEEFRYKLNKKSHILNGGLINNVILFPSFLLVFVTEI